MYVVQSLPGDCMLPGVFLDVAVIPFMIVPNNENVSELLRALRKKTEPCLLFAEEPDVSGKDKGGFSVPGKYRNRPVLAALLPAELVVDVRHDSEKHQCLR
jgi:hypothetical protein